MTRRKTSQPGISPRQPRMLGIGTVVTVLGIIGVLAVGRWNQAHQISPQMGRIVYQADAAGKLQRVNSVPEPIAPPARLWKPEVGFLLAHAAQLQLDAPHKQFMARQDTLWTAEKETMARAMRQSTANISSASDGTTHPAVGVGQLSASLQNYSAISVRYDQRRRYYWLLAISALTPAQRAILTGIETSRLHS